MDNIKIPKIIHYCWFGGSDMPDKNIKCIDSWKKYCPDYEIKRWDETNYDINKNLYMKQAYEAKKWAFVSDYARLDIIYNFGGIYLDVDVEIIKNLDPLLENEAFMGFESTQFVALGLGFGAIKGNIHIGKMIDIYNKMLFLNQDGTYNMTTIPVISTEYLEKIGLVRNGNKQTVDNILVLSTDYLCPKEFETGKININKNTYSIHHFDASWLSAYDYKIHLIQLKLNKYRPKSVAWFLLVIYRKAYTVKNLLYTKKYNELMAVIKSKFKFDNR
jgi:hypothetical protein